MSLFHFIRLFKQSTDLTPYQYVQRRRVEMAKKLLNQQNLTVLDISKQTGFQSSNYFSNIFCKYAGVTPTSYRKY
ncbi:helix-turn-helix transcriptional regulator [Oculatella sp. FACHB-28]|nr:helix-turn-helix transcriptional regulator [Oculatella sp. FACHB-28]